MPCRLSTLLFLSAVGCSGFLLTTRAAPCARDRHLLVLHAPRAHAPPPPPCIARVPCASATSGDGDATTIRADADEIFDVIDFNGDDRIEYVELHKHLCGACGYPDAAVEDIFALIDADANGEVTRDELVAAFTDCVSVRYAEVIVNITILRIVK